VACHEYGNGLESYRHCEGHSLATRIVAVVDAFVSAVEAGTVPTDAVMALNDAHDRFDPVVLPMFLRFVGPHPIGSVVELSTGEVAVVSGRPAGRERVLAPEVRVVIDGAGARLVPPRDLDLAAAPGIRIVRARDAVEAGVDAIEALAADREPVPAGGWTGHRLDGSRGPLTGFPVREGLPFVRYSGGLDGGCT